MNPIIRKLLIRLLILVFTGAGLSSCEKIIGLNESDVNPVIVVSSIICPDSIFKVHLSETVPVLDSSGNKTLTGRYIEVYENNVLVKTLRHVANGSYFEQGFRPSAGKNYRIRIINGLITEAEAETSIPLPVPVLNFTVDEGFREWGKALIVYVTFKDPVSAGNYYRISLNERAKYVWFDESKQLQFKYLITYRWIDTEASTILKGMGEVAEDQIASHPGNNDYYIFTDVVINGTEYSLKVITNYYDEKNVSESRMDIIFQTISKDYYYYLKSRSLVNQNGNNPFAEPVQAYSNIKNGIGIFGGFSYSKKSFNYKNPRL